MLVTTEVLAMAQFGATSPPSLSLPQTHGAWITVGEVVLEVWPECVPCDVMELLPTKRREPR